MNLIPTDPAQPCVVRCWDEDGYSWHMGNGCFCFHKADAVVYESPQVAWEVIANLRHHGWGRRDEGPSPNLSVQPV